ncbi:MAG: hypothetical protein GEU76_16350, partial [Alphaproteobacteria bacterium]|nr:hypothetical protein [Alphaproteobacteria bacterium]
MGRGSARAAAGAVRRQRRRGPRAPCRACGARRRSLSSGWFRVARRRAHRDDARRRRGTARAGRLRHAVAQAFAPRREAGMPEMVLAEAETGTGKTLGYIAPASVWAEKNKGAVWISTFT